MTPEEFVAAVRDDNETALSRLGSSKSLYADTGGEMDTEAVLAAVADAEHAAAETFRTWAADEAHDAAREVFARVAEVEERHYETVVGELDEHEPGDLPAVQAHLRDVEGPVERLGGLVGRTLAAEKSKEQVVGFFVGQASPGTAETFRDLAADLDGQLEGALDALAAACADDEDWAVAREAADAAIRTAYGEYTERLETMGVNPKPVC
jgi:hypothetical protein